MAASPAGVSVSRIFAGGREAVGDFDAEVDVHGVCAEGGVVVEEDVVAVCAQAWIGAEEGPDPVEGGAPCCGYGFNGDTAADSGQFTRLHVIESDLDWHASLCLRGGCGRPEDRPRAG